MAELLEIKISDADLKKIKEIYMSLIPKLPEDKKQAELEFWKRIDKLPWEKQRQFIWFRFSKDYITPELQKLRAKYLKPEMKKTKEKTAEAFKKIVTGFIPKKLRKAEAKTTTKTNQ